MDYFSELQTTSLFLFNLHNLQCVQCVARSACKQFAQSDTEYLTFELLSVKNS